MDTDIKVFREAEHPRHPDGRFRGSLGSSLVGDLSLTDIADAHARENLIQRFEARTEDGTLMGSVHRDGDTPGARWVARALHGETTQHDTRSAALGALAGSEVRSGAPIHAAHLRPGDRFRVVGGPKETYTLTVGWVHRKGDTSLRTTDSSGSEVVVKLGDGARVVTV